VQDHQANKDPKLPMQNVVFATDFLESSRLALDYAVAFSHHYGARLTIMHAFELSHEADEAEFISGKPSLSREHALTRLQAFATGVKRTGVNVDTDLREGDPCAAMLDSATQNSADLLVLGTHGIYRGLQHVLVGSNAEKVLLSSRCPTLTVGRHVMAGIDLNLNFNQILYISDFSPESVRAARYAADLAHDLDIPPLLLPVGAEEEKQPGIRERKIEAFCAELDSAGPFPHREWCDPAYTLEQLVSAEGLLDRSRTCSDTLMVLGVHARSRLNRHMHASFAYELVAKASCPLLSIRAPLDPKSSQ
jgi:nucleotide-binding universal stress UspA family protein